MVPPEQRRHSQLQRGNASGYTSWPALGQCRNHKGVGEDFEKTVPCHGHKRQVIVLQRRNVSPEVIGVGIPCAAAGAKRKSARHKPLGVKMVALLLKITPSLPRAPRLEIQLFIVRRIARNGRQ